ncbi:Gfo/Idh/MocA family protein [Lacimicrobium alkaliphilum]|uniref:Myo-inositol 2-dehydrogenase n=1 Tax=Lacimicrobium alkaliphilum TaxID=1526571 RepID=A0A0U3B7F9_9ALTE|nr:Gfo/Idh/MocA family oxidoreductase [Lacimicrobium alkaliphilum]ALS97573.1 myo-inositol 2-dehydrogenase [Lacimicrobium alkaliphilum]
MRTLKFGLIGTGYMGKSHAIALHSVAAVFPLSVVVECEMLADITAQQAAVKAKEMGFSRATGKWHELVNDNEVDVVDICAPNGLHKDIALAAIKARKHVYCEKPLALNAVDSLQMALSAEEAGVKTMVGFNYIKNPATQLAKQIIDSGEIGDIVHFRGTHNEDYLADASVPMNWRLKRATAGAGALADLGSHIINVAQFLVGAISAVNGDLNTVIKERSTAGSVIDKESVENDDQAHAMLRFNSGAIGTIEASRVAWGRKMGLTYEVTGSKGSIVFDQEHLAEIQLYTSDQKTSRQGFKRILIGPEHPDYQNFCASAGHGVGYNDQKIIEVRDLIEGISRDQAIWPDFRAGYEVALIIDAIEESYRLGQWVHVSEVDSKTQSRLLHLEHGKEKN